MNHTAGSTPSDTTEWCVVMRSADDEVLSASLPTSWASAAILLELDEVGRDLPAGVTLQLEPFAELTHRDWCVVQRRRGTGELLTATVPMLLGQASTAQQRFALYGDVPADVELTIERAADLATSMQAASTQEAARSTR